MTAVAARNGHLPFVAYGRISRMGGRASDNLSRRHQEASVERIAQANRVELLADFHFDEDRTGTNFNRPAWQEAVRKVRDGEAGGIVAYDLHRMTRDEVGEQLAMVKEVEALGGQLFDGTGQLSCATPTGELMLTFRGAFNHHEARLKGDGMNLARKDAVERGVNLAIPFGYMRSAGKGSKLTPHPEEAPLVRLAFELRVQGLSWERIARALDETGVRPRPYTRDKRTHQPARWKLGTVRAMVGNEVYRGVARSGAFRTEDAHEALVDAEMWARANQTRGTRQARAHRTSLLAGLVRCAGCGHVMTYQPKADGRGYYRCRTAQLGTERCEAPATAQTEALDNTVVDAFCSTFLVEGRAYQLDDRAAAAELETQIAAASETLEALAARLGEARSASAAKVYERQLSAAEDTLAGLDEKREQLLRAAHGSAAVPADLDEATFRALAVEDQRQLLSAVYAAVVVRRSVAYREPVVERSSLLLVGEAPTGRRDLIDFVAGADA